MERIGLYRASNNLKTRANPRSSGSPGGKSAAVAPFVVFLRVLLAIALLAAAAQARAQPLSLAQQQVLRDARNANTQPGLAAARTLAVQLAKAGNAQAVPFLVELGNPYLLNDFANEYTGPSTPEIEQLVIAHRHERGLGGPLLRMLRGYRSRALFEALLADLRGPQDWDSPWTAQAIVRTELPVEAELAALLPQSTPAVAQVPACARSRPPVRCRPRPHPRPCRRAWPRPRRGWMPLAWRASACARPTRTWPTWCRWFATRRRG